MAKLRHIAILVADPEASAVFFERAFDMARVGVARCGIYLSDGTVNVALLKIETEDERPGIAHFGMWVDELAEAEKKVAEAGGTLISGLPETSDKSYESKFQEKNGIVFDLTDNGWVGAVKDVVPGKVHA